MDQQRTAPSAADFERLLFASARDDRVPEPSRQRVALALGLQPSLLDVTAGDGAEGPSAASATRQGAAGAGRSASHLASNAGGQLGFLSKSLLVGLAGGAIAIGMSLRSSNARNDQPARAVAAEDVPAATSSVEPAPLLAIAAPAPSVVAAPERAARALRSRRAQHGERASRAAVDAVSGGQSRLRDEVRLLDEARSALAAKQPSRALVALARYAERFPNGTLALDAAVLEVRALDRAGDAARAHRLALQTLSRADSARYRAELEMFAHPLASGSRGGRSRH